MGDSQVLLEIASRGGVAVAFNYNPELEQFLKEEGKKRGIKDRILFVDPKSHNSDLRNVISILNE